MFIHLSCFRMPGVKQNRDYSDNDDADHYSDSDHSSEEDFVQSDGSESEESSGNWHLTPGFM